MPQGKLQVLLVSARGLKASDSISKVDPCAVLICQSQEQKSSVLRGLARLGRQIHEWNETFEFTISSSASELVIKILDEDLLTADDFVGEAKIPLEPVFEKGKLPVSSYNVLNLRNEPRGEVKLSLSFIPETRHSDQLPYEETRGWRQPFYAREQESGPYGYESDGCVRAQPS